MHLDPRGGHNRKEVNHNFFKDWSPGMAYVLGLIYSDGAVEDVRKSSRTCYLAITSKDKSLLMSVRKTLSSNHKLHIRKARFSTFPGNRTYLCTQLYTLRIGSKLIYQDLIALGLTPRKSLVLKFPSIPNQYLSFFIRGYFDGDGCVMAYIPKGRKKMHIITVFTCGSKRFLDSLSKRFESIIGIAKQKIHYQGGAFRLRYRKQSSLKLLAYIYKNLSKSPHLDRKYAIYQNYLKIIN